MKKKLREKWGHFKTDYPRTVKWLRITVKVVAGGVTIAGLGVIGFVFGYEPKAGNNNSRAHRRKDGREKVGYDSKERANLQVIKDCIRYRDIMVPYVCPSCGKFHLGHKCKTAS